ncbi:MAG: LPS export ABC transporter periplasmic protein LptC [Rikenellaceae bacterium]
MIRVINIKQWAHALLIVGGAALVVGCGGAKETDTKGEVVSQQRVMSEKSINLTMIMSENGRPSYIFKTPLVEGYTLGREPYREFREGVDIVTFTNDSLNQKESTLVAKYAIYYENQKLWKAVGDVEVHNKAGRELYSQQLFWNAQTQRIYSNVETTVIDNETGDIYIGEGFESDEAMESWKFRKLKGKMRMEIEE